MSETDVPRATDGGSRQRELAVFISIRTILLVGVAVALAWALASIGHVLLLIFVSVFSTAGAGGAVRGAAESACPERPRPRVEVGGRRCEVTARIVAPRPRFS